MEFVRLFMFCFVLFYFWRNIISHRVSLCGFRAVVFAFSAGKSKVFEFGID